MAAHHPPRVAAIGLASWDQFLTVNEYPAAGSFAIVQESASLPGGTTANTAVALARLGATVSLVSMVGDDAAGRSMRSALTAEGIDRDWVGTRAGEATDAATVIVSRNPPDRTIFWRPGARLVRGDRLDIATIFDCNLVFLDADDLSLRRFLVDLPAHTTPTARLLGGLTYLADARSPEALDIASGHDAIVGNERELREITGSSTFDQAVIRMQDAMRTANLRACAISRGATGATIFTVADRWDIQAFATDVVDTTGAGDAFAGGVAYGMTLRWEWPRIGRFANAVAALSLRALGSQTALPTLSEVASLLGEDPRTLAP
jgi:ribokinase